MYILRNYRKANIFFDPPSVMVYVHSSLVVINCWPSICLLIWFKGGLRLFSDVWSENAALFKRFMKIHQNPRILYFGFKIDECYIHKWDWHTYMYSNCLSIVHSILSLSLLMCGTHNLLLCWASLTCICTRNNVQ